MMRNHRFMHLPQKPFLWLLMLNLFGCYKNSYQANENMYDYDYAEPEAAFYDYEYAQSYAEYDNAPFQSQSKRAESSIDYRNYKKEGKNQEEPTPAAQMIHYNGYLSLSVARMNESISQIGALAKTAKGDIERQSESSITIRVPKDAFEETFAQIMNLGDVLTKNVSSEDVTEAFTSVELRLQTAKTTRDRLLTLLEKSQDEKEKIEILRQIQRLNEQIDIIEAQMRTLQDLADYSSITVDLSPRKAVQNGDTVEPYGMNWIHSLSPFQNTVCHSGKRLELETPIGFVSLHPKGSYIAESADGTVLRATKLPNQPNGDSQFWQNAIDSRISSGFNNVQKSTMGEYSVIQMEEDSDNPYIWMIAVRNDDKYLEFIEVYYPTKTEWTRHQKNVETAILGGAQ